MEKNALKVVGFLVAALLTMKGITVAFRLMTESSDVAIAFGVAILLFLGLAWACLIGKFIPKDKDGKSPIGKETGRTSISFLFTTLAVGFVALSIAGCGTTVKPGYAGIKVNRMGDDKGVQSYPLVTGWVWYNPLTETVFDYPTFVQTAVWTKTTTEGSPINEEITFNSKEGMVISGDISLSYELTPSKVPSFYVKFRSDDLNGFTHGFLRNVARDAFTEIAATYSVDEIYGPKKEEIIAKVRTRINKEVDPYGVVIQQFGMIGAPRLPQGVVDALNSKIKATQDAIRVENELRSTEGEAKKAIAKAEGEAKANALLTSSLTPQLLEWERLQISRQAIAKWNGATPSYFSGMGSPVPFVQLPSPK